MDASLAVSLVSSSECGDHEAIVRSARVVCYWDGVEVAPGSSAWCDARWTSLTS